jgi:hypothetical protein
MNIISKHILPPMIQCHFNKSLLMSPLSFDPLVKIKLAQEKAGKHLDKLPIQQQQKVRKLLEKFEELYVRAQAKKEIAIKKTEARINEPFYSPTCSNRRFRELYIRLR